MDNFEIDLNDFRFLLHEILEIENMDIEGYSELDDSFTGAIIEEAYKISRDVLAPLNAVGDIEGCKLENGVVRTPTGFKKAFDALCEGGWTGLNTDPEYGGQGLPAVIGNAVGLMQSTANMSMMMYPGLTHGAYSTLHCHASEEQKATYLPKMVSCEWTGTMNLTEPQCGTDLGLIRTKAVPEGDAYKISGQKIFISAGDHDMAENIIHLVLARLPDAPEGVKGISLFIVPKFLVNEDGSLGARNGVSVGKIEEKMGIHGNSTCVLNYDEAIGYLVGEPHKGLKYMFTMMNEARLGVGLQGVAQAEGAYMMARAYAKDRLQGRDANGAQNPDLPADPLIVHPDIRRSLMIQKSFIEGGRAFLLWGATLLDRAEINGDKDADALLSLLIPVIKAFLTDKGFECAVMAQQIFGGHGYIEETGVSQFVRDARIAMIYEGANGIHGLDLIGRKLPQNNGAAARALFGLVIEEIKAHKEGATADIAEGVKQASKLLQDVVTDIAMKGMKNKNYALAGATDLVTIFGHVTLGYLWLKMAGVAQAKLDAGSENKAFYEAKLTTARFYINRVLPEIHGLAAKIKGGEKDMMALSADQF